MAAQGITALIDGGGRMLLVASPLFDADDLETIRDCQRRTNLGMVRAGLVLLKLTRVFRFLGLGQRMLTSRVK